MNTGPPEKEKPPIPAKKSEAKTDCDRTIPGSDLFAKPEPDIRQALPSLSRHETRRRLANCWPVRYAGAREPHYAGVTVLQDGTSLDPALGTRGLHLRPNHSTPSINDRKHSYAHIQYFTLIRHRSDARYPYDADHGSSRDDQLQRQSHVPA